MIEFKDFEPDSSWGGLRARRLATAVEKLNAWVASEPGIKVINVETVTWLGDEGGFSTKPFEKAVRLWFVRAE